MQLKPRINELDALRGIAALAVVIFHFTMPWKGGDYPFFSVFSMGVDLFFVISGFVIFMTIDKGGTWRDFAWNRLVRLYPTYWVAVTFTTLLFVFKYEVLVPKESYRVSHVLLVKYLANMTMLQYYFGTGNIDGPYWTLIVELCFYFFMIVLMVTKKIKHVMMIGWIFAAVCACYSVPFVFKNRWLYYVFYEFPLMAYFPLFFGGMLLYKMKFEKVTALRLFAFVSTLVFQCLLFNNSYENKGFVHLNQYVPTLTFIYGLFLLFLFDKLGFIVNPVTMWLGKVSYSLYLIHQFVGIRVLIPQLIGVWHMNYWVAAPIALMMVLALSYMIYRYVEVPSIKYLKTRNPFDPV